MHKSEIREMLGDAMRKLASGDITAEQAGSMARLGCGHIGLMNADMKYAGMRGEKPSIPELDTEPASQAGRTLAKSRVRN